MKRDIKVRIFLFILQFCQFYYYFVVVFFIPHILLTVQWNHLKWKDILYNLVIWKKLKLFFFSPLLFIFQRANLKNYIPKVYCCLSILLSSVILYGNLDNRNLTTFNKHICKVKKIVFPLVTAITTYYLSNFLLFRKNLSVEF